MIYNFIMSISDIRKRCINAVCYISIRVRKVNIRYRLLRKIQHLRFVGLSRIPMDSVRHNRLNMHLYYRPLQGSKLFITNKIIRMCD